MIETTHIIQNEETVYVFDGPLHVNLAIRIARSLNIMGKLEIHSIVEDKQGNRSAYLIHYIREDGSINGVIVPGASGNN